MLPITVPLGIMKKSAKKFGRMARNVIVVLMSLLQLVVDIIQVALAPVKAVLAPFWAMAKSMAKSVKRALAPKKKEKSAQERAAEISAMLSMQEQKNAGGEEEKGGILKLVRLHCLLPLNSRR
jgi:hypothetical protein